MAAGAAVGLAAGLAAMRGERAQMRLMQLARVVGERAEGKGEVAQAIWAAAAREAAD